MRDTESSFLQYIKFKRGLALIESFEKANNFSYDVIIKTRCDLNHHDIKNIDLSNLAQKLIVAKGNVFPNDCILISSRNNIFKIIDFMTKEFYNYTNPISNEKSPHGLLYASTLEHNLEIQLNEIMNFVVRANTIQYYPDPLIENVSVSPLHVGINGGAQIK
jgi:hypothetical protein